MTLQQANRQLLFQLFHIYEEREAANIADLVMEKVTEWKRIDRILNKELVLLPEKEALLATYITELSTHKPVQYVLNEAWFYGMKLYVDENVLIPRPETEELLDWVLQIARKTKNEIGEPLFGLQNSIANEAGRTILDIGTGSGCIALALKKSLPGAKLVGCDISEPALAVARKNAFDNKAEIEFLQCDFLKKDATNILPDSAIIVSNPPYIPLQDKISMLPNVLHYEPPLALFVEDHDPLIFYIAIADFAIAHLIPSGVVFVEIHELMGERVKNVFLQKGFDKVVVKKDLQGKERMVSARLPSRL